MAMDRSTLLKGLETYEYVMKMKKGLSKKLGREVTMGELEAYIVGVMDVLDKLNINSSQELQGF